MKKRIQIAINGKKKRSRTSQGNSYSVKKATGFKSPGFSNSKEVDDIAKDSVIPDYVRGISFALMDTVVRIYYDGLTDSVLNNYKTTIRSFISRTGTMHISEISLTDYYSEEGFTEVSVKSDIGNYLLKIGVSKHRLFWTKNKRVKPEKGRRRSKKLLYLEIRFH